MNNIKNVVATSINAYQMSNLLRELPNPDKVLSQNGNKYEVLNDLLSDPHVFSCIQSRKSGTLKHLWSIDCSESASSAKIFLESIFKKLKIEKIITGILDAPLFGWAPLEVYWQTREDGYIVPVDIVLKPQEWFFFEDSTKGLRFRHKDFQEGIPVPDKKFFICQHEDTYQNPYGKPILSKCFWPVFFKKEAIKSWARFCEKFGIPTIIAKVDMGTTSEIKEKILEQLEELTSEGSGVVENEMLEIVDGSNANSPEIFMKQVLFHNSEISKAILSQTLTTEQGDTGSYAMSQTHLQVRDDVIDSDKKLVEYWFNKLIKWIIEINSYETSEIPKFLLYKDSDVDLILAQRDQTLSSTGQIRFSKIYFTRNYGFKDDEIEIVIPQQPAFAEDDLPPDQTGIDRTSQLGTKELASSMSEITNDIVRMIKEGNSFDQIQQSLIDAYDEFDTQEIEELMAKTLMIGEVAGNI